MKTGGSWDIVATIFKEASPTFQKRVMNFVRVLHPFVMRKNVNALADKWTMLLLSTSGQRFANYPYACYATDVTFQQTNVPPDSYADKNVYYRDLRAVIPIKKPAGGILTMDDIQTNDRIATDRVIVENFIGRLKTLWSICSDCYRWTRQNYDVLFRTCVAMTNVHIRMHPLRADDGDVNVST
ncbi:hypothetical protein B5M09_012234 [Aphanomyces astaci]|uniref:DDE Tnp4 domain-containing protein n=1 Tax=Aphanomyces astaci TaxID=112090 RepID=A0A3R7X7F9_APHAT|nr:hypothetical protein B5M09_012234 [Aphanomyces astaci]